MKNICLLLLSIALTINVNAQKQSADQIAAKKVAIDFLKWYSKNDSKLTGFQLYKGKKKKDQPPYIIDWKAADKYFEFIRKSVPYFGETWIENEKKFLKETQTLFDKNPTDEMAIGFDYDRFTGSQESASYAVNDYLLSKNTKINAVVKGDKAQVFFAYKFSGADGPTETHVMELKKEAGGWKIAKNITPVE